MKQSEKNKRRIEQMKKHIYESMLDTPVELHIDNLPIKSIQSDTTKAIYYMDGRVAPFFVFRTLEFAPTGPIGKYEMTFEDANGIKQREYVSIVFDEEAGLNRLKSFVTEVKKATKEKAMKNQKAQKASKPGKQAKGNCPECGDGMAEDFGENTLPEDIAIQIMDASDYELSFDENDELVIDMIETDGFIETEIELPNTAEFAVEEDDPEGYPVILIFQVSLFPEDDGYKFSVTNIVAEYPEEEENSDYGDDDED